MPNSKNWTKEKAHEYYLKNRDKFRIEKRRRYLEKKRAEQTKKLKEEKRA
jgi:hypothetical protein